MGIGRAIFDKFLYEGQCIGGLLNGFGRCVVDSGCYYIGYFKNNVAHGFGKFVYPNGYTNEGIFIDDEFHGFD